MVQKLFECSGRVDEGVGDFGGKSAKKGLEDLRAPSTAMVRVGPSSLEDGEDGGVGGRDRSLTDVHPQPQTRKRAEAVSSVWPQGSEIRGFKYEI